MELERLNRFYDMGFHLIPTNKEKIALVKWEQYQSEKPDWVTITEWFNQFKGCNWVIICGDDINSVVVADFDDPHIWERYFKDIKTLTVRTPSGGIHLYFKSKVIPNKIQKVFGYALDIQGAKSYVVCPGSKNEKGAWEIIEDSLILEVDDALELVTKRLPANLKKNDEKDIDKFKKDIKKKLTISDYISKHVTKVREGHGYWQGLCPFHNEKEPSFTVYEDNFYCFGCGEHGDIIDFVMKIGSIDFKDALSKLSELTGIKTPTYNPQPDSTIPEMELKDILALNQKELERRLKISLPHDHFITQYVKWLSSISDGYIDYQIVCGFWILSALTKGRVALKLKQDTIKPNLWFFNIGKSTTSRKSTIINKTRRIYEVATDVTLYNDDYSLEGYLETLAQNPINNFVRDEAAGLLAKYHKKYNEGIFEAECAIYDCQNYKKTLASGKSKEPKTFEINYPYVTKLYATTPDNLARYMNIDDFQCGYGYRFLFVHPNYKHDRKPLELETSEDIEAWSRILTRIKTLAYTNTFAIMKY
jgi:hypothetical protein